MPLQDGSIHSPSSATLAVTGHCGVSHRELSQPQMMLSRSRGTATLILKGPSSFRGPCRTFWGLSCRLIVREHLSLPSSAPVIFLQVSISWDHSPTNLPHATRHHRVSFQGTYSELLQGLPQVHGIHRFSDFGWVLTSLFFFFNFDYSYLIVKKIFFQLAPLYHVFMMKRVRQSTWKS